MLCFNRFKNVIFEISPTEEVGDFEVKAKFMGVQMETFMLHYQVGLRQVEPDLRVGGRARVLLQAGGEIGRRAGRGLRGVVSRAWDTGRSCVASARLLWPAHAETFRTRSPGASTERRRYIEFRPRTPTARLGAGRGSAAVYACSAAWQLRVLISERCIGGQPETRSAGPRRVLPWRASLSFSLCDVSTFRH